jgi:hypothetical protein
MRQAFASRPATSAPLPLASLDQYPSQNGASPLVLNRGRLFLAGCLTPHARINFDGNRYSVPPELVRRLVTVRATRDEVRVLHEGRVLARHARSYERGQLIVLLDHRLAAIAVSRRSSSSALEHSFDALGPQARLFHLGLKASGNNKLPNVG